MRTAYPVVIAAFAELVTPGLCGAIDHPIETTQIAVVSTPSWAATTGTMQLYSRSHGRWTPAGDRIAVVVGRNGFAWGMGLHKRPHSGAEKIEGDGCSPAGIFSLGPSFGYSEKPPGGTRLPYRSITDRDYYVDDSLSREYNQWVRLPGSVPNEPDRHWRSAERMRSSGGCYELGIVVHHNMSPTVSGKGSAIFLHIWENPDSPTAGCTAMSKTNMQALLRWLDPRRNPLLVQSPEKELPGLLKQIPHWHSGSSNWRCSWH